MRFRIHWPTEYGTITQKFGENPRFYNKFGLPGHEGLDFRAPEGTEIYAAADGIVTDVRLDEFADPLLKPYGNQVRIQHEGGFKTIYAHLSEVVVMPGQVVKAGQLIGLAGSTGNSSAAHLHLSLKRQGATTAGETGYPYDLVDPEPYLMDFSDEGPWMPEPPVEGSMEVQVESPEVGYLNVRKRPYLNSDLVTRVDHGAILEALEPAEFVHAKVGEDDRWLWIRTPDGTVGYVAAWYVEYPEEAPEPDDDEMPDTVLFVEVDSPEESLKIREGPGTEYEKQGSLPHGTVLKALESPAEVRRKVGEYDEWIRVQTPTGLQGYCAAWYLVLASDEEPVVPEPEDARPTEFVVVDSADLGLRVRAGPGTDYEKIWWVPHKTVLRSLESPDITGRKIGDQETWIHVETPARYRGYVAAWYVRRPATEDTREPVEASEVPLAISPHIFGIHAVTLGDDPYTRDPIRGLFADTGKRGWIFFTELCGRHPHSLRVDPEMRRRLWDWVHNGYGVIIRLNNGYEPSGTLPESRFYEDFARAAARWVELYLKNDSLSSHAYRWTIQIGNEQNNPREHPGGFEDPIEHITPELYAEAFDLAYAEIKRVLPNTIVCPGAIDPFNYMPMRRLNDARWRPLDYFTSMMANIEKLDGIILHAYTHGPNPEAVTHLKRFGDGHGPLGDHYYDFQTYRLFMERVPAKWRDLPAYITEMNHIHRPAGEHDQGWLNQNVGWVREVYEEINRWNQRPYAQQIRCGLLYRWTGDQWALDRKPKILDDFKQALQRNYRWRAPEPATETFSAAASRERLRKPAVEKPRERTLVHPDDLTQLWGLGDKGERVLNAAGIKLFEQLAALSPSELERLIDATDFRAHHPETWPEQARLAVQGDWEAIRRYKDGTRPR
jgi:predicted flap endonuclease-1-like 5' DNA nuclease